MRGRLATLYLALGTFLVAGYGLVPHHGVTYDVWYEIFSLSSVGALLTGVFLHRPDARKPWFLLAAGQALFAAGDGVYLYAGISGYALPYPSVADWFYLCGYPLLAWGLLSLIRRRTPGRDWVSLIDAAIITTGLAAVMWVFLIEPYTRDSSESLAQKLVSMAYPLMDVLLLAVAARMLVGSGRRSAANGLLALAVAFQLLGDSFFGLSELQGWYTDGNVVDVLLAATYLVWGAAALHPSMRGLTEPAADPEKGLTRRRLSLLTCATLLAPAMLAREAVRGGSPQFVVTIAASVVLFALVIARLAGLVARHERAVLREARLRRAAADLVGSKNVQHVYRTAVAAAMELAGEQRVHAELLLASDGSEAVVASSGADDPRLGKELVAPIVDQAGRQGALLLRSATNVPSSVRESVETLASQVALALERESLVQDLLERQSVERFRSLVQNATDVIAVLEEDLTIRYHTPSVEEVLGYAPTDLVGTHLTTLVHPDELERVLELFAGRGDGPGAVARCEFRLRHFGGEWRTVEATVTNLLDDPNVVGFVLTAHDVTERKALEEQLSYQAFHDPLTDLANRALFTDRVAHALARRRVSEEVLSVLFLDIDDFKTVNDSLGHGAGDEVLAVTAERLRRQLRAGDTCARLGGDEFAVLLEDVSGTDGAARVAAALLTALAEPVVVAGRELSLHASIGIALAEASSTVSELLRNADLALYRAKSSGKNRSAVFERSMHAAVRQRLELKSELQRAVERRELELYYQPIVRLDGGEVVAHEALLRWSHPTRGLLLPDHFVPLAEETGLIIPLGRFVLDEACDHAVRDAGFAANGQDLHVNVSARQLQERDLAELVAAILARTGLPPERLTLEITETELMADTAMSNRRLAELKEVGVRIAIDDFGTGYSSLEYLRHFPVDMLKIAKQFVDDGGATDGHRLLSAIVRLGSALELGVLAEGVERPSQRKRLLKFGCPFAQGFLFARPHPAAALGDQEQAAA